MSESRISGERRRAETAAALATDLAAIGGVVALGLYAGAEPSVAVGAVAGLGGYRMRRRGSP